MRDAHTEDCCPVHGCEVCIPAPKPFLYEILVPTAHRVSGNPIRTRHHRIWDGKIRAISKGLTILAPAKGQWVSPDGVLFSERMIPVRIAATREQMKKIAAMTLVYYDQLAIM